MYSLYYAIQSVQLFKLIRTDTTLDLSLRAEKQYNVQLFKKCQGIRKKEENNIIKVQIPPQTRHIIKNAENTT